MTLVSSTAIGNARDAARSHLKNRDLLLAAQSYRRVLESTPGDLEASHFLASQHLEGNDAAKAIALLSATRDHHPGDAATLHQLGTAHMVAGDYMLAAAELGNALERAPNMFVARLRLAISLERLGRGQSALMSYLRAINDAQAQGRWLSDDTTAPGLREAVKYAMDYVDVGRRQLFDDFLQPLQRRYGASEMSRVERCISIYLNEQSPEFPDPRQQPKFLYFPGIPSQPFYPRERFPWQSALEASGAAIRDELRQIMAQPGSLESFLQSGTREEADAFLKSSSDTAAAWDAYFFYRHGERYDAHCDRCPATSALLDRIPLVRIREHAPETLFSVLSPGTHILPHRGVTNTRLVTHLPLIVPSDCALRVGGETHIWQQDQCVTFDDTFEHEAWNRSTESRVVLIIDSWNPDLTEAERHAVTDLVAAIGDLNRDVAP